jgi:arylsulfatase A-like enzyme
MKNLKILALTCILFSNIFISAAKADDEETPIEINLESPNVIFFVIDDLNDWPIRDIPELKAPNMRKMAREGINFTHAYSNSPLCNPSRASFMSGKLPHNLDIYGNLKNPRHVYDEFGMKTIPENFSESGYHSIAIGKIFHYIESQPFFYDEYIRETSRDDFDVNRARIIYKPFAGEYTLSDEDKATWFKDFISKDHDKPFFLNIGFEYPHLPWIVPQKYFDMYPLDSVPLRYIEKHDITSFSAEVRKVNNEELTQYKVFRSRIEEIVQAYMASLTYMDEQLGKVLDDLEKSKYADNTVLVLTSDHGYHLGEKSMLKKRTLWETGNHVPLIFKIPGIEAMEIDSIVSLIDIFPTLNELCNLNSVKNLDGNSLVSLIRQTAEDWSDLALSTLGINRHSIRDGKWRFIRYANGDKELYNVEEDPEELNNLVLDENYADLVVELEAKLPARQIKNKKLDRTFSTENMTLIRTKRGRYWMDNTEVTNEEFSKFVEISGGYKTSAEKLGSSKVFFDQEGWQLIDGASWAAPYGEDIALAENFDNLPVVHVSYRDAKAFCRYKGKRLPTELEWQISAGKLKVKKKTKKRTKKWLANIFQGEFPKENTAEDDFIGLAPVKSFPANANGLFDMAGNVWEWVIGPSPANKAVIKGGSFLCNDNCQGFKPKNRQVTEKENTSVHVGFRCAGGKVLREESEDEDDEDD